MIAAPFVLLGMAGALLIAFDRALFAQAVWCVSNTGLALWNLHIGQPQQAGLFAFYLLMAVIGIAVQWAKARHG